MNSILQTPNKSILHDLKKTTQYILNVQTNEGAIPWYHSGKLDPWDHTEAAMGLCISGHHPQARQAYLWLAKSQLADGSWHACYNADNNYLGETTGTDNRETNFVAYIATGVWHYYLITKDKHFLKEMFPCIQLAINFILSHQSPHGEISWAVSSTGKSKNDALITACSSILRSLECACKIATELNISPNAWVASAKKLKFALTHKPERFDRTWESKSRFSMDWYYPILAGIHEQKTSREILNKRWSEFVVDGLGCRCVNDEPWVTMAETCELVIALVASDENIKAVELFNTLNQWCDTDGGYWTGYVFRDKTIWPEEKTTWTAGAVILAADAVHTLTPAATLFTQPIQF